MNAMVERWRAETPGSGRRNHLNSAGASLMPGRVVDAMTDYLRLEAEIGGYEAEAESSREIERSYADIAALLQAAPRNIAVTANATASFIQALSSFDWTPGDTIVTTQCDYTSNQIQYLALQKRCGVVVRHAADLPEGGVDPDAVRELLERGGCKLVAVTWVPTNSGLVQDVVGVGQVCAEFDVPYLVDACQAVGQLPIDVAQLQCDYLSATARKFLRGPRGVGFLYASDRALARGDYPLFVDMRGGRWTAPGEFELAATAQRYEDWEFAYALVVAQGEAARYALDVGLETAGTRASALAARAREGLEAVPGVRVLDRGHDPCAIVTAATAGWPGLAMKAELYRRGINTSATLREYGILDFDAKGVESAIRISPHYFNLEEEVDEVVDAIAEIAARPAPK